MFTTHQDDWMEGKQGTDHQNYAASAADLYWIRSARQHTCASGCFPERETIIIWLCEPTFPAPIDVHRLVIVKDLCSALRTALQQGYTLALEPVRVTGGTCAIIQDASGLRLCLLEQTQAF